MRRLALMAILLLSALPARAQDSPPMLVLVTSPAPMTQAMAMILSREALSRQTPVRMVLCGPAGELALNSYVGPAFQPSGLTAQQMLRGVIQAGAQVQVCPIFLANTPGAAAALIDGVAPTTPADVGAFMNRPEVRFLNF
jgi:hypothetical protein